ncbi:hypothetical protein BV25DRAFT_347338 [Artomyces pyxidatus]|uniref:Uncharacterized protein n=1 Tax=Artomyces pyxidatus TaxID=48021 RepID=A0ACB8T7M7_9AGAM|nr:hypothetical protein BV25DRAFT_347338 [Artomyces pyxidatus]
MIQFRHRAKYFHLAVGRCDRSSWRSLFAELQAYIARFRRPNDHSPKSLSYHTTAGCPMKGCLTPSLTLFLASPSTSLYTLIYLPMSTGSSGLILLPRPHTWHEARE